MTAMPKGKSQRTQKNWERMTEEKEHEGIELSLLKDRAEKRASARKGQGGEIIQNVEIRDRHRNDKKNHHRHRVLMADSTEETVEGAHGDDDQRGGEKFDGNAR